MIMVLIILHSFYSRNEILNKLQFPFSGLFKYIWSETDTNKVNAEKRGEKYRVGSIGV
jgi:hypothetical protein